MLASFTIENFKSYHDATLKLAPLTVLVGANASGKSNAVEALRLLSWIAQGGKLGTIRHEAQAGNRAMRGAIEDFGFRGDHAFALSCRAVESEWERYSVRLETLNDGELRIVEEELVPHGAGSPFFRVAHSSETGGDMQVAYNDFKRGGKKPQVTCTDGGLGATAEPGALRIWSQKGAENDSESRDGMPAIVVQYRFSGPAASEHARLQLHERTNAGGRRRQPVGRSVQSLQG